jgi:hypothetical protein
VPQLKRIQLSPLRHGSIRPSHNGMTRESTHHTPSSVIAYDIRRAQADCSDNASLLPTAARKFCAMAICSFTAVTGTGW